jgi:hypothetical protein
MPSLAPKNGKSFQLKEKALAALLGIPFAKSH